ncbi:MAG: AbrB/MazE/SpoVT family DNA-binding domain-containing protein [Verrucomicrobiales bacterium]
MTITVKGQIAIPQALWGRYGLLPGTEVDFIPDEDGLRLRPHKADAAVRQGNPLSTLDLPSRRIRRR